MEGLVDVPIDDEGAPLLRRRRDATGAPCATPRAWVARLTVALVAVAGVVSSAAVLARDADGGVGRGGGAPPPEDLMVEAVTGFGRGDGPAARGAAVCVTGQVGRLEIESKLHRLITPLAEVHGPVDVLFVLADVEPRYTNHIDGDPQAIVPQFRTHASIADQVRSSDAVANVHWFAFDEPTSPAIPDAYAALLDHKHPAADGDGDGDGPQRARARNHARTFYHYSLCGRGLAEMAVARNAQYATIVRVRDDAYAPRAIDVPLVEASLGDAEDRVVVTSACDTWGGVNVRPAGVSPCMHAGIPGARAQPRPARPRSQDKIAFFRPQIASAYFDGPLEDTFLYWNTTRVKRDVEASGKRDPLSSDAVAIDPEFVIYDAITRRLGTVVELGANAFAFAPAHTYRPYDDPATTVNCIHVKEAACFCQGGVCDDLKEQGFIVSPSSC